MSKKERPNMEDERKSRGQGNKIGEELGKEINLTPRSEWNWERTRL